ncbi:MAG: sulfatase-like hydrolase/transferase, partial [Chitinivibrionales bacterium]|nr:sulfatase-like hydrolase/transferase [Chitinivibrionales bacterium]
MSTSKKPNILVITTDQQRWDALSLWGTPGYRTPNIDGLAADGVCFGRSYCPSPVCTPARVSMITGQYSTRHGAYTIGMSPVPALEGPTLGSILGRAGYRTAIIGKTHFVARKIEDQHVAGVALDSPCPESEFWRTFDGPYCGFHHVRHHRHHNAAGIPNAHYRVWLEDQ